MKTLPGSTLSFTRQQISDGFGPADWFPGDHPAMPDIVAHGKRPDARACGLCHYPNGKGRQENAGVSGLPVSYFIQQMNDFRDGLRKSAEPRKANTNVMIAIAKAMTPEEIKASAEYFGAMKWTPWVRVVESSTVPKVESRGGIWIPVEGGEKEPIGVRIVETPENPERTEILRDPRSGFIAYAPVGSIKKGETLVKTGGNKKTVECGMCHGSDLQGLGPVPGIAGPLAQLSRAADVRHAGESAPRRVGRADDASRREAHRRGLRQHRRVRVVARRQQEGQPPQ